MSNSKNNRSAVNFSSDVGVRHTDSSATFVSPQTSRATSRDDLAMSRSYDDLRQSSKSDADASDQGVAELTEVVSRSWWERTSGPALSALKTRFRNRSPEILVDDDDEDLTATGEDLSQARSRGRSFSVGSEPGHVSPQAMRCQGASRTLSPPRHRQLAASAVLGRLRRTTAHMSASVSEHVAQEVLGHLRRTTRTMSGAVANRVANQVSNQLSNPVANQLSIGEEWSDCDESELQHHIDRHLDDNDNSNSNAKSDSMKQESSGKQKKHRPRASSLAVDELKLKADDVNLLEGGSGSGSGSGGDASDAPRQQRSRNESLDSSSRTEANNEVPVSSRWSIFSGSTATGSPLLEKKAGPSTPPRGSALQELQSQSPAADIPDEPLPARPSRWTRFFGASGTGTAAANAGAAVAGAGAAGGPGANASAAITSAPATVSATATVFASTSSAASAPASAAGASIAASAATAGAGAGAGTGAAPSGSGSGSETTTSAIGGTTATVTIADEAVREENAPAIANGAPEETTTTRSSWWTWRRSEGGPPKQEQQQVQQLEQQQQQGDSLANPATQGKEATSAPPATSASSSSSSWWTWMWSSGEVPPEKRLQASTTKAGTGIRSVIGSVEWLYADATQIVDSMIPSSREAFSQQEFEWADLMEAGAKISDLSVYLSSLPTWFWIFVIVLVYNIVFIAESVMEMWMDAVIFHFGIPAVCLLLVTVCMTWPVFIWYLIQTFSYAREVLNWHTRIVLMFGVPKACGSLEDMASFCRVQKLNVEKIIKLSEDKQGQSETCNIELVFPSVEEMHRAFREELLSPHLKLDGAKVRVRPKLSMNAAMVEWWIVAFKHLNDSVPERYWLRATLSCLITMSLMKHLTAGVVWVWVFGQTLLGILGWLLTKFAMCISLLSMLFFVGYHAFEEIRDAHKEIHNDQQAHRTTGFTSPDPPDVMDLKSGE